ncbi:MAG: hypothetical protein Q8L87_05180 [Anaerolineales bacterium]|nr:hypothetical protein [Anaerolineales bacterium]
MLKNTSPKFLLILIAIIQLFDILIHAATDQLEFLRVTSNLVILLWLAAVFSGKFDAKALPTAVGSIGLYLILNMIFLAREGMNNSAQGGEPRVTLFVLVLLTVILSTALAYRRSNSRSS